VREVRRYRIIDPRVFLARSVDPGVVREVGFDRDGRLAGLELGLHFPAIDRKAPEDLPHSGGDSGPMVIEPNGRIDVLYQGYHITNTTTYAMDPGYEYFTASSDGGTHWSSPVQLGPNNGTMSLAEWWIDGDIEMDSAGNLYAVWDTQGSNNDIGWLSYSTDHGANWSTPTQVPPDQLQVPHVMEVAGGGSGIAYVSFFSSADPRGYADYLRTFSITRGWLSDPTQVSSEFGDTSRWPGDTFGISTLSPGNVVLSWGSATGANGKKSDTFAVNVGVPQH